MQTFWRKGYSGSSMHDLTEAMQINAPSLYSTYGDKHKLLMAALRTYQQSQQAWIERLLSGQTSARESIRQLLNAFVTESLNDPDRKGCFIVNTTTELAKTDPEVFRLVADNEQAMRNWLAVLLKTGQQTGEIQADKDPQVLASYLFALIQGLRVLATTNADRCLLTATIDTALSVL